MKFLRISWEGQKKFWEYHLLHKQAQKLILKHFKTQKKIGTTDGINFKTNQSDRSL